MVVDIAERYTDEGVSGSSGRVIDIEKRDTGWAVSFGTNLLGNVTRQIRVTKSAGNVIAHEGSTPRGRGTQLL